MFKQVYRNMEQERQEAIREAMEAEKPPSERSDDRSLSERLEADYEARKAAERGEVLRSGDKTAEPPHLFAEGRAFIDHPPQERRLPALASELVVMTADGFMQPGPQ